MREGIEDLLGGGVRVEAITDLGASHSWTLHRASLSDGREVFVKAAPDQPGVFAAEAAGLNWLAASSESANTFADPVTDPSTPPAESADLIEALIDPTEAPTDPTEAPTDPTEAPTDPTEAPTKAAETPTDPTEAPTKAADPAEAPAAVPPFGPFSEVPPVPEVLADDDRMLILPWLPHGTPTPSAAERFGRELAAMHSAAPPGAYGAPWEGFIADLPLDNTLTRGDWPDWYAERRLEPFLRLAADHLGPGDRRLIERVLEEIGALAGPPEPPSRIHGDLWSGNVLWTEAGRAMVIDPAAHGGHRETDLAMLALFGAPHLDRILAAYDEASPLADGWRDRVPLHQLHPLLVHVALFGAAYRARTVDAARAALATAR